MRDALRGTRGGTLGLENPKKELQHGGDACGHRQRLKTRLKLNRGKYINNINIGTKMVIGTYRNKITGA